MALLIFVIPESPSWLIHKKLYSKADEALEWLSRDHEDFAMEIEHDLNNRMNKVLQHQTGSPQEDPSCWKKFTQFMSRIFCNQTLVPFFIIVTLFLIQNWSGFIVTIMYTVVIFEEAQMEINEFQATMIIGGVQVVGLPSYNKTLHTFFTVFDSMIFKGNNVRNKLFESLLGVILLNTRPS